MRPLLRPQNSVYDYLAHAVAAAVLLSAILKLAAMKEFVHVLGGWSWLPVDARPWLGFFTPILELLLSASWFLGYRRAAAGAGLVVLLLLFRAAYSLQLASGGPAECGCFGRLGARYPLLERPTFVVVRNTALVLALALSLYRACPVRAPAAATTQKPPS